ncbi:hypothetical protein AB0H73_09860 [Streptomyces olivoreticuli]
MNARALDLLGEALQLLAQGARAASTWRLGPVTASGPGGYATFHTDPTPSARTRGRRRTSGPDLALPLIHPETDA